MKITKRNGKQEELKFDKISKRIERQTYKLNELVDSDIVATKVIQGLYEGISTEEIDLLASETAASLITSHPDYSELAARLAITALQKDTPKRFTDTIENLHKYIHPETGEPAGLISDESYKVIMENKDLLNSSIIGDRDFNIDYFGFKTLERSYLLKTNGKIAERIQHFWMRVSVGIWGDNIEEALKTYELLSNKRMIHATPTLFNAGTKKPQMSSCFLLQMRDDSIRGIYETLMQCAEISQSAGGIGFHMSNVRAKDAYIKGTNGVSNGIVPMLRNFDMTARYVDQGGGRRKGSFAVYIEPWHADIFDFLDLKKNHGKEESRARDLFYALWNSDLFMERVNKDEDWTLMSPDVCPGLQDAYGEDFKELYEGYEAEGKGVRVVKARELWNKILESQTETGTPYMLYKDAANLKSNQKNIGTIKSSNLCTEIMEVSNEDEVAVCNLGSIALPTFVKSTLKRKTKKLNRSKLYFDFEELYDVTYQLAKNLNRVIDVNYYPVPEAKNSNMRNRPIGIGVQGLADAFAILGLQFDSDEAKQLNKDIFETIYFAAITSSKDTAKVEGPYKTFKGSPISKGIFQFDMWEDRKVSKNKDTKEWEVVEASPIELSGKWDWEELRKEVMEHGVRNSLLLAPMPTASTSQILGNNECFEPFTANIYKRNTLSGEFPVINKHLVRDLVDLDLWSTELSEKIISEGGSVQNIPEIPTEIKEIYRTVWEMKMRDLIDMSADRGAFIDQSQSLNLFITDMNNSKLTAAHFYGWQKGLKTGMYYLRTEAAADANAALGASSHKEEAVVEVVEEITPENKIYVWSGCPEGKMLKDMNVLERRQYDLEKGAEGEDCLACGS